MNRPYANLKSFGKTAAATALVQKHSNKGYVPFIQNSSSVLGALVGFVPHTVVNILVWGAVTKIACRVIVPVSVKVTHDHSFWSGPYKSLGNYGMNVFRSLPLVLRSFLKGDREVYCCRVRFTNKSFSVSDRRNTTKTADFVSFVPNNGQPHLWEFRHG